MSRLKLLLKVQNKGFACMEKRDLFVLHYGPNASQKSYVFLLNSEVYLFFKLPF